MSNTNNETTQNWSISIFEIDQNKGMVNLTKIANSQNKQIGHWLSNKDTQDTLQVLAECDNGNPISVVKGGNQQGTWGTFEVALDLAQWISPRFKVFCLKHLKKLLQTGKTELDIQIPKTYSQALLEASRLALLVEEKEKLLLEQKPKVEFAEQLLESTNGIPFNTAAKAMNLPFGRNKLFAFCRDQKWLDENNEPYQIECENGNFVILHYYYVHPHNGDKIMTQKTMLTAKGESKIISKLKKLGKI